MSHATEKELALCLSQALGMLRTINPRRVDATELGIQFRLQLRIVAALAAWETEAKASADPVALWEWVTETRHRVSACSCDEGCERCGRTHLEWLKEELEELRHHRSGGQTHLEVAAPDLLRALKLARNGLDEAAGVMGEDFAAIDVVDAAIAKAEGLSEHEDDTGARGSGPLSRSQAIAWLQAGEPVSGALAWSESATPTEAFNEVYDAAMRALDATVPTGEHDREAAFDNLFNTLTKHRRAL